MTTKRLLQSVQTLAIAVAALVASASIASASMTSCSYSSTQVRVQPNEYVHWSSNTQVTCGESFRVGGFHDGTGQLASDMMFEVTSPDGKVQQYGGSGVFVVPTQAGVPGKYHIVGKTNGSQNWKCMDTASVNVVCTQPPVIQPPVVQPPSSTCAYSSTQARVQVDATQHWQERLGLVYGQSFNVGSFHNHSGQFATDTAMTVRGTVHLAGLKPLMIERSARNGETVYPLFPGEYTLLVTTPGQSGVACEAHAQVSVTAGNWVSGGWRVVQQ